MPPANFPFTVREHLVPAQHIREFPRATARSQEDVLHLAVKEYVPIDNPDPAPGDVTVLAAHANGFPKELYEALWVELHAQLAASGSSGEGGGFRLRAIWVADVANQGYSGQANEALLGDDPSWHDHARDLLHVVNVFRDRLPRPLVGLGHSFGGNILARLALLHPRLMHALVLLDPVVVRFSLRTAVGPGATPARSSVFRRDAWPSRAAAREAFERSAFYRAWDPRVLDAWCEHALRDLPTPLYPAESQSPAGAGVGVTLRTTKHQEVFTFLRPLWPHVRAGAGGGGVIDRDAAPDFDPADAADLPDPPFPFYRGEGVAVLRHLPELRPAALWVFGGDSDLAPPPDRRARPGDDERVAACGVGQGGSGGLASGRVQSVIFPNRGHLFPMEVPRATAAAVARWLGPEIARWQRDEAAFQAWAAGTPARDKVVMGRDFLAHVPAPVRKKKKERDGETDAVPGPKL
ncbi:prolyl aminopeptidase-like protein [Xylariaceae sp. FL0804]|nr:prolyl aminopeptidase-like protein [Xylariaceae sp. FL0804]